jgi:ketosteroid isomerase-like protein
MTSNSQSRTKTEIRDLIENWAESVRNLDIEGAVASHAEDMLMFDVPPPVQIRGIDGYRQTWPPFFDWLRIYGVHIWGQTYGVIWGHMGSDTIIGGA